MYLGHIQVHYDVGRLVSFKVQTYEILVSLALLLLGSQLAHWQKMFDLARRGVGGGKGRGEMDMDMGSLSSRPLFSPSPPFPTHCCCLSDRRRRRRGRMEIANKRTHVVNGIGP